MTDPIEDDYLELKPEDNPRLINLCGQCDEHIDLIADQLTVDIRRRGFCFNIHGDQASLAKQTLQMLYAETEMNASLTPHDVHLCVRVVSQTHDQDELPDDKQSMVINIKSGAIKARGHNQSSYLKAISKNDINFGIGPSGTGKTYLAVAMAVHALQKDQVNRIVLVRPAVEAGENLGFLPGDLTQKVDPYLRPLYDALYEMLGFERVHKYIERSIIEIAPLAFMRGRTLNHSFIILDESQNTTPEQMKMFLTRIGFGSKAVVTGDITQTDLARGKRSGLKDVMTILKEIKGISFTYFESKDVVRHKLVQRIVEAYDHFEKDHS